MSDRVIVSLMFLLLLSSITGGCLSDQEPTPPKEEPGIITSEIRIQRSTVHNDLWDLSIEVLEDFGSGNVNWTSLAVEIKDFNGRSKGEIDSILPWNNSPPREVMGWYQKATDNVSINRGDVLIITGMEGPYTSLVLRLVHPNPRLVLVSKDIAPLFVGLELVSLEQNSTGPGAGWDAISQVDAIDPEGYTVFIRDLTVRFEYPNGSFLAPDPRIHRSIEEQPDDITVLYISHEPSADGVEVWDRLVITNLDSGLIGGWMYLLFDGEPMGGVQFNTE